MSIQGSHVTRILHGRGKRILQSLVEDIESVEQALNTEDEQTALRSWQDLRRRASSYHSYLDKVADSARISTEDLFDIVTEGIASEHLDRVSAELEPLKKTSFTDIIRSGQAF